MTTQSNPLGAAFGYSERVTWDEAHLGMSMSGQIVTPIFDALGAPTRVFVIQPDPDFSDLICTCKNGWVQRHMVVDSLRAEQSSSVRIW